MRLTWLVNAQLLLLGASASWLEGSQQQLELQARTSEIVSIADAFIVLIDVRNTSVDEAITIDSIVVELPESMRIAERQWLQTVPVSTSLQPDETIRSTARFDQTYFYQDPLAFIRYRCAINVVVIQVFTSDPDAPLGQRFVLEIRPRSVLIAVISGGILGVLLASIFSALYKEVRRAEQPASAGVAPLWERIRSKWWLAVVTFLYGSVVTAAAIYLLSATTVPDFPISISLCDSLGGLIIGLFFKPLGGFVHSKLSA